MASVGASGAAVTSGMNLNQERLKYPILNPLRGQNKQKRLDDNTTYHLRAVSYGHPKTRVLILIRAPLLPRGCV